MTPAQCCVISFEVCQVLSVSSIITVILLLKHSYCEKKQMIFFIQYAACARQGCEWKTAPLPEANGR